MSLVDESGHIVSGCDCESYDCDSEDQDGCPCFYELIGSDMASECGPSCGCELECGNRLTQQGVSVKLKIVRDSRKGWSLYADQFIQKAQFVCEYAGISISEFDSKVDMNITKLDIMMCKLSFKCVKFDIYF